MYQFKNSIKNGLIWTKIKLKMKLEYKKGGSDLNVRFSRELGKGIERDVKGGVSIVLQSCY